MQRKTRKIIIRVLAIATGFVATFILAALSVCAIMDKTNGSIVSSGITRRYLLYVPTTYDRSKATPLVISIHPAATWPAVQAHISRWNELAEQRGFIVVYPAGSGAFFGGYLPGPHAFHMGPRNLSLDVRFISDLMDKLEAEYHIDRDRIYANGMSNGGGMAFELGCKLPGRIAAVALVAPALTLDYCAGAPPVPLLAFHGTADRLSPYLGGSSPVSPGTFPHIPEWTALVARRNQCAADPGETRVTGRLRRLAYTGCARHADVVLYTVEGGGHTWPGSPESAWMKRIGGPTSYDINATAATWDFFVQHPRAPR